MHPAKRILASTSQKLAGKTIVLGVTGSIAAVKTVELARELIRHGAEVRPVMTRGATEILHPNALWFATGIPPVTALDGSMDYLAMVGAGGRAHLLLVAPCTANTISKIATGVDDSTVTTYATNALGSGIPILIAPAAHESMMANPIVAENLGKLRGLGVDVVEPKLEEEKAKLADIDEIVARVIRKLGPADLVGKRVLVIAGSTMEPVDDIRVITNRSSGATGIEIAKAAFEHGGNVELWLGAHRDPPPPWIPQRSFETTEDLDRMAEGATADVYVVPAAISDFAPRKRSGKVASKQGALTLELVPTPKIIEKLRKGGDAILVGFKAESGLSKEELTSRAMDRLKEAGLDFIVANDVRRVSDNRTAIVILDRQGRAQEFEGAKSLAAEAIWRAVLHGVPG